ncbi:MAG TPA: hypothetical protein VI819_03050 [Patescibacteria group bacterium]|nr:hypothetical protein [Patescibacteria group bacterium]
MDIEKEGHVIRADETLPGDKVIVLSRSRGGVHPHKKFYSKIEGVETTRQDKNPRILGIDARGHRISLGGGTQVLLVGTEFHWDGEFVDEIV